MWIFETKQFGLVNKTTPLIKHYSKFYKPNSNFIFLQAQFNFTENVK